MTRPWSSLLSHEAIVRMVGREAFARAVVYVRTGRVHEVALDADRLTVTGRVAGSYHDAYETTVTLRPADTGLPATASGRCSCPVAMDCKHAAAVALVARTLPEVTRQLDRPAWETTLTRLARALDPAPAGEAVPLGLQLDVEQSPGLGGRPGPLRLRMRPVRQGKSGRWVHTGVSWDDLEFATRSYLPAARETLLQLRSGVGAAARYAYPRSPWLPLTTVSPSWWGLLAAAEERGLSVVPPPGAELSISSEPAAAVVDVRRRPGGDLALTPEVLLGGHRLPLPDLGLLGEPAHGIFTWRSGDPATLTLAPLREPLNRELRQLVLDAESVHIPAADAVRFTVDFYPAVWRKATLISSDASVDLPEPPAPVLTCAVHFRPEHRLRLDWGWAYEGLGGRRDFGLEEPVDWPSVRDTEAERRCLAELPLPYDDMPQLRRSPRQPEPAAHALLEERQAVLFVEEVVPRLRAAGVEVDLLGEVVAYRSAQSPPRIEVATADREDSADWFDLHVTVSVDDEQISFDDLFVALARHRDLLITPSGVCVELERPVFAGLRTLIEESQALADPEDREEGLGRLSISKFQAGLWEELVQLGTVIDQSAAWARTVGGLIHVEGVEQVPDPKSLRADLRPYQREGYWWLWLLYEHNLGGILADDMGLGKTVQALALICRAREHSPGAPAFLVTAPTSVVFNWASEAARFAPELRVVTIDQSLAKGAVGLAETVAGADLVITSYTRLRLDARAYAERTWAGMILDEAQFVKNHRAKTYAAVRRVQAPFKLAITGTPLENSLMDLWALLSITAPGLFPHPERFTETYRRPIERGHDAEVLARLRRRIRPLMLRRTKDKVAAELPPKQEQVLHIALEPQHQRIYSTHLQRERQKVLGLLGDLDQNRFSILRSLTLLRQLALDPSLVDPAYAGSPASKVEVLTQHLVELAAEDHAALVFSQFTGFLNTVRRRLDLEHIGYSYLDGKTRSRSEVVAQFRRGDTKVFLISLKAGGFGLNLIEADYCFVLDPWWNPASENQAIDRTHRIGQDKTVMVYRLVAAGTIEEKVMQLKARKAKLIDSVLGPDTPTDVGLTAEDIRGLLG